MNATIITTLLTLIQSLLPQIGVDNKAVNTVLTALISLVPIVVTEAQQALPAVKNIIAALSSNPATTDAQLATLKALDAKVDQAFEDAVTAYLGNHPVGGR